MGDNGNKQSAFEPIAVESYCDNQSYCGIQSGHTSQKSKKQPWKASWPPQTEIIPGEYHGVAQGLSIEEDGSGGAPAHYPRF